MTGSPHPRSGGWWPATAAATRRGWPCAQATLRKGQKGAKREQIGRMRMSMQHEARGRTKRGQGGQGRAEQRNKLSTAALHRHCMETDTRQAMGAFAACSISTQQQQGSSRAPDRPRVPSPRPMPAKLLMVVPPRWQAASPVVPVTKVVSRGRPCRMCRSSRDLPVPAQPAPTKGDATFSDCSTATLQSELACR
jgi:hypothetical protein